MKLQSKKLIEWTRQDYTRTVAWFALHTAIFILGFFAILYVNAGFNWGALVTFIQGEGAVKNLIYLVMATCFITVGIYFYFYNENRDFLLKTINVNLIFLILEISVLVMFLVGKAWVYLRPFALCALLTLLLIDKRTAIFMNTISCFFMFMIDTFLSFQVLESHVLYSSLLVGFLTSILAVYLVQSTTSRLAVFLRGFLIAIPVVVCIVCLEFGNVLKNPFPYLIAGFTSGMLSVVLMMAILPVLEKVFNRVTAYRLTELIDRKAPLIRKLQEKALGTFNHCVVVSNLVEACAAAIGEDPLLARACAFYHDMGKLTCPEYFTENQLGRPNPHNEIPPELSVNIIHSHAREGAELIKKHHLPQILADAALQHHGTMPVSYFFIKACKYSDSRVEMKNYRYPGPRPQTKIAAILMIADACEAKSRSLKELSHKSVDAAVRSIIEERIKFDQFDECDLTTQDIEIIRTCITDALAGVHHSRVEYPKTDLTRAYNEEKKEGEKANAEEDVEEEQTPEMPTKKGKENAKK